MKRWIRPQGIIVFFVLVAMIATIVFILSGPIVGRGIEKFGTAAVGAKVDVGSAHLSFSPLGVIVTGLQVTNPQSPMENTIQVGRIAFNMNPGALVRRKLLIEEMAVESLAFNTPRRTSGAISKPSPAGKATEKGFHLPSLRIPPVSEILAQETLPSVQRADALKKKAAETEVSIKDVRAALPDKAKAKDYQNRLDKLLSASGVTKARLDEAKTLQKEIRTERDKIRAVEDQITANLTDLRSRMTEAKGSVGEDVKRLKEKYALTPEGLTNITRTLFGEKAGRWAHRGTQVLKLLSYIPSGGKGDPAKAKPSRGEGLNISFKEHNPLPDFWIKRAAVSLKVPSGAIEGEARDFASDQGVQKKPATLALAGRDLPGGASLVADGILDHIDPADPRDVFKVNFSGWRVSELVLSENESFPITLREGSGIMAAEVVLKGQAMMGSIHVDLSAVDMETGGAGDSPVSRAMRKSLKSVKTFSLKADVGGTLDDPDVRLSSDLDRIMKDAVGQAVEEESARLEAGLRTAIEDRTRPALADAQTSLQRLEAVQTQLASVKADLEEALKAKAGVKLPF